MVRLLGVEPRTSWSVAKRSIQLSYRRIFNFYLFIVYQFLVYFNDKINFMNNKLNEVVIVSAIRTPIGAYKGSLKNIRSDQLGSIVIKEVLKQSKFSNDEIDDVIMGQVLTAGAGQNPARQAAINAGIPISKPAHLINQVCGSGLRAVISGYQSIKLGESLNIISGGQENMSIAPHSIFYREKKNNR